MKKDKRAFPYTKNGYYYIRVSYYLGKERKCKNFPTGIQVGDINSRTGKQREREVYKIMAEVLQNFVIPGTEKHVMKDQLFADTVKDWLKHQQGSKAPSTLAGYQYVANDIILYFTKICPVCTTELTSRMVECYLNWERERRRDGYKGQYAKASKYKDGSGIENTVMHRSTMIRSVLQFAKRSEIVVRNVASTRDSQIDLPSPQRHLFPVLSKCEAKKLLCALKNESLWFRAAVMLGLLLGLRRSEIVGLRIHAIDWAANSMTISQVVTQQTLNGTNTLTVKPTTKTHVNKNFKMNDSIKFVIETLVAENKRYETMFGISYDKEWDGYLVRYPDGRLVSPNALTNAFQKFLCTYNLKKIRFHDLRHSCASILFADGIDLLTIQEILGHKQLTTTMIYTHGIGERKHTALTHYSEQLMEENEDSFKEE